MSCVLCDMSVPVAYRATVELKVNGHKVFMSSDSDKIKKLVNQVTIIKLSTLKNTKPRTGLPPCAVLLAVPVQTMPSAGLI